MGMCYMSWFMSCFVTLSVIFDDVKRENKCCTQVPKDDGGVFPMVFKLSCGDPFRDLMRYVSCFILM